MGLRINHNIEAMNAQNSLRVNNLNLSKSLQKLSTGYRINVAADGPAALTISEKLRAQITGINQAIENSEQAINLITTSEGALIEVNDLLNSIRQLGVHAANEGTVDSDQIAADQAQVDSAIRSIDRIVNTTKYGKKYLLNGSQAFDYSVVNGTVLKNDSVKVTRLNNNGLLTQTATVNVYGGASQASTIVAIGSDVTTSTTLAISGNRGTEYITLSGMFTAAQFSAAVQALTATTGVWASANSIKSVGYGADAFAKVTLVKGTYTQPGYSDYGADAVVTVNGQLAQVEGLDFKIDASTIALEGTLSVGASNAATNIYGYGGGMKFQLGDYTNYNEQETVGIEALHSGFLGDDTVGFLSDLITGGQYDLTSDPSQAVKVIDAAIDVISGIRARLGAFQKNTLETNINSLSVTLENITASESRIRDANMAYETTQYTKNQILVQSSTSILAQANLASQNVLQLLQ